MDSLQAYFLLGHKPNLTIGVNISIEGLQKATEWITSEYHTPLISMNKGLSQLLIGKQEANYSKEIIDWLSLRIKEKSGELVLLTDIDILFEPSFELDPLVIFRQVCRNKTVFVLWPGEFRKNILSYGSPEHAHYRKWVNPGVEIVNV